MLITFQSGINDTAFGKIQAPVKQYVEEKEELVKAQKMLEMIFPVETSENFGEHYGGQTSMDNFKPGGEASRYPETDFQDDWGKTIENDVEWKNSFSVSLAAVEDFKLGKIKKGANRFITSYYNTMEEYGGKFLSNANSTSFEFEGKNFNITGGDGKALFATDHPSKTGKYSDQSNLYNMEFSYENLSILETVGADQRSDNGKKLNVQFDTIILPASSKADALQLQKVFEALNADGNPNTADRAGNYHLGRWNVIYWTFLENPVGLTSGKSWFMLMDSSYCEDFQPFVLQKRIKLSTHSYVDDNTDNNIWKGRSRAKIDTTNSWQGILAAIPGVGTVL